MLCFPVEMEFAFPVIKYSTNSMSITYVNGFLVGQPKTTNYRMLNDDDEIIAKGFLTHLEYEEKIQRIT